MALEVTFQASQSTSCVRYWTAYSKNEAKIASHHLSERSDLPPR